MIRTLSCHFPRKPDICEIVIQNDLMNHISEHARPYGSKFAIITDDQVALLYGKQLCQNLSLAGLSTYLFSFPHGESSKNRETKRVLEDQMFEQGFGRDSCVLALGGGVVTDLAGYIAATYCRGIPLFMIPTSLLGMVDASIGGKTGVNTPYGKNLLGCIFQPKKILIDPRTLTSLPQKEMSGGAVEMIKHGLIADKDLFEYLEANYHKILEKDTEALIEVIFQNCRIKKTIVEEDEKETGKRVLLNYGHTVGHALEKLSEYTIPHGEAVAMGILVESYLSLQLGWLDELSFKRIQNILLEYNLPMNLPKQFDAQSILHAMTLDKKSVKGIPRFVTLNAIGSPHPHNFQYCISIEERQLKRALDWIHNIPI